MSGARDDRVYDATLKGSYDVSSESRSMDPAGHIELSLPADSRYMRLARLVASGVATSSGLPLEEVEDFRIAVDELCATLIEMGDGQPVILEFDVASDSLVVSARTAVAVPADVDADRLSLSRQILDVVTDGHGINELDGHVELTARKLVRSGGVG
jgi:serine/threonine-protein kinase RsbW